MAFGQRVGSDSVDFRIIGVLLQQNNNEVHKGDLLFTVKKPLFVLTKKLLYVAYGL